jgi:hypothetical protein
MIAHLTKPEMIFGGLAAVIGGNILYSSARMAKRGQALAERGFLDAGTKVFEGTEFGDRTLLNRDSRLGGTVLRAAKGGTGAGEAVLFDYQYWVKPGDSVEDNQTRVETLIAFRARRDAPDFSLQALDRMDRMLVGNWHTRRRVTFPERAGFDERFAVFALRYDDLRAVPKGEPVEPDPAAQDAAIRAVFTTAAQDALEGDGDARLRVDKRGDWLFVYRYKKTRAYPGDYARLLESATRLAEAFRLQA